MSASDPNESPTGKTEGQSIKVYDRPEKKGINPAVIALSLLILFVLIFIIYSVIKHR